jgi:hypothetical protein
MEGFLYPKQASPNTLDEHHASIRQKKYVAVALGSDLGLRN